MNNVATSYANILLALAVWREARGSSRAAKSGVKHVILNRVADPKGPYAHCKDVVSTILCPYQFSSFTRNDPNAALLPNPATEGDWAAWLECCSVVDDNDPDGTSGATHYFDSSIKPPAWADPSKVTVKIDHFTFYRL